MSSTLSVVVPIFNAASYLNACLLSIRSQEYTDLEILLVNDGSTDRSEEICLQHQAEDSRIRYFYQENQGQSAARNLALRNATGRYLAFVDSDDTLALNTFTAAIRALEEHPECDQVQFPFYSDYGTERPIKRYAYKEQHQGGKHLLEVWWMEKKISWIVCNKIYLREVYGNLYFKEGMVYEDNLWVAQSLERSRGVLLTDVGEYYYWKREGSTMVSPMTLFKVRSLAQVHEALFRILTRAECPEGMVSQALGHVAHDALYALLKYRTLSVWRQLRGVLLHIRPKHFLGKERACLAQARKLVVCYFLLRLRIL